MAHRVFRPYEPDCPLPRPPDLRQWLPSDHLVYFSSDIVAQLDLAPITAVYHQGDGGGNPPYHPELLTKLLLYAYCQGVVSARTIAAKTYEDVAFRVLTADQHPDFRTISDFRERHLAALTELFTQVVRLAGRLGLTKLEHVAQDGTKILANASKHRAMSYGRMRQAEERFGREIRALLAAARAADAAEDAQHGRERPGDELPPALAAEAWAQAAAVRAADAAERTRRTQAGERKKPGRPPDPPEVPPDAAQRNFTDPDSRLMKNADRALVQAYNGQAAVDAGGHQFIVGCDVTNQAADAPHLQPMVAQVRATTGRAPGEWSADAGYFSAANVAALEAAGIAALIPPDAQRHAAPPAGARLLEAAGVLGPAAAGEVAAEAAAAATMRAKLRTDEGRAASALRKQTAEPVFGQLKERRGLRRFLLRGLAKVRGEWTLWCLTHNLRKLAHALQTTGGLRERLATA